MPNNTEAPQKDIVSFDQALELCSLEFNEATFCMYEIENKQLCLCYLDEEGLYMPEKDFHAPTKSQVFRWFRDKYNLVGVVRFGSNDFTYYIYNGGAMSLCVNESLSYNGTYDEAESACINKLIELVKQQ